MVADICSGIANGASLRAVCRELEIDPGTVCGWLAKDQDFADQYRVAKEAQADVYAEDIIEYARRVTDPTEDKERLTPEQAKVAIAARQWAAGKTLPKKYGDKLVTENTTTNYVIADKPMSQDDWEAKYCLATPGRPATSSN
jgi:hypothetical protein